MTEQEPKEKLEEAITDWLYGAKITSSLVTIVLALIKGAGYVQLTDDQSLPPNDISKFEENPILAREQARQEMLQAGWRKVQL